MGRTSSEIGVVEFWIHGLLQVIRSSRSLLVNSTLLVMSFCKKLP